MTKEKSGRSKLLNTNLAQLLARWPASAQVLIAHRMACIGCEFSKFHTIQQALDVYKLPHEPFLSELNAVIKQEEPTIDHPYEKE